MKDIDIESLTAETILSDQVYEDLLAIEDEWERQKTENKILLKAREFRLSRIVEKNIQTAKKSKKRLEQATQLIEQARTAKITNFFRDDEEQKYPPMFCGTWFCTENGITSGGDYGQIGEVVCYHPIMPIRRLKNIETEEEQVVLAYRRNGSWHELTVPKTVISSTSKIVDLAKYGILVTSENARLLVRFLMDIESYNEQDIPIKDSTSKLGWRRDSTVFLPYDKDIQFDGETRFRQLFGSIAESGDYSEWMSIAKSVRANGYLVPRIALAASFASVLLKLTGSLPFIVDFWGNTESGKAQPLDTKIITPYGYKLMGDVRPGDYVTGEDGQPYRVTGVYPQGKKEVYEITFKDGTHTRCCKEHLWKVTTHTRRCHNRGYTVMSVEEMLKRPIKNGNGFTYRIPVCRAVEYDVHPELKIDPYMLGLLIGDGCTVMTKGSLFFSNTEQDILDYMQKAVEKVGGKFKKNNSTQCQYLLIDVPDIKQAIKDYGLNVKSGNKFIPDEYFYASIEDRKSLLAGLFDTDGNVCKNTGSFKYSTTSKKLAEDVCNLSRSLGYRAKVYSKIREGKSAEYSVAIYTNEQIFRSKKHIERSKIHHGNRVFDNDSMIITDIKKIGMEECQCIMLDSKDHTYLCDDFIVTHNTVTLMLAASVWANPTESRFIGDFKTTDVALEVRCDMLNSLPLILDDTSKATSRIRENFESLVYDLCSGKGKSRSNKELGANRECYWQNVTICNGERPLSEYVDQGGAINRILDVECGEKIFDDPQFVAETVKRNYGFAGKQFIWYVKTLPVDEIKRIQRECEKLLTTDETMQKQVIAMAAILTADKIATDCIFKDGFNLTVMDVMEILTKRKDVSEGARCYQYILDCLDEYSQHFQSERINPDYSGDIWGEIDHREGIAYFIPAAFEDMIKRRGFHRKPFTSWARKAGLLIADKKTDTKVIRTGNSVKRMITLRIDYEYQDNADNFQAIDDSEMIFSD